MFDGAEGHGLGGGDDHAFATGQAVRLDHERCATASDEIPGGSRIVELLPSGGGNGDGVADLLGERLAPLQLGGRAGGTETGNSGGVHRVGDAGDEWGFGAGDDEVDAVPAGEVDQRGRVMGRDGSAFGDGGDPRVAGRTPQLRQQRAGGDRPAQRMLARA